MIYRAVRDCTDFNGRRFSVGEMIELPSETRHSIYLVPAEWQGGSVSENKVEDKVEKEAAPEEKKKTVKRVKRSVKSVKQESEK